MTAPLDIQKPCVTRDGSVRAIHVVQFVVGGKTLHLFTCSDEDGVDTFSVVDVWGEADVGPDIINTPPEKRTVWVVGVRGAAGALPVLFQFRTKEEADAFAARRPDIVVTPIEIEVRG